MTFDEAKAIVAGMKTRVHTDDMDTTIRVARENEAIDRVLSALKPRVMNGGDLFGYEMGVLEYKGDPIMENILILQGGPDVEYMTMLVCTGHAQRTLDLREMGKKWRIWTQAPMPEDLKEADWDG